ncbi:MAG TPA: class I SAM-dependent DNA methyltransferase, partial [Pseudomonadota bacterium]|nr:class I SAM-dependent DNA methyltransferase [Pseudomonadota bacterium]
DRIWTTFWTSGLTNPLEVLEQLTYLLFLRRLDEPPTRHLFPDGLTATGCAFAELRWSRLKHLPPRPLFSLFEEHVFPFLRALGLGGSAYAHHMKDARFTIPQPELLARVVELIDRVPLAERDTAGDLYEYMLSKLASAGHNGQFRTPRHLIRLMIELTAPGPADVICDPAAGTCGFLVAASEYLRAHHGELHADAGQREHFHRRMFHGFDFDRTMLRIGSMNMLLHGVEAPDIAYRDALAQDHAGEKERYSLVLANPPFTGSLDHGSCARELLQVVRTRKTELLFLALGLRLLRPGGRAAVIVPDGVLFGASAAHRKLRALLIEEQRLEAVISLPGGAFKPYAGVSTAIVLFTKTDSGGTDHVWFYEVTADGWSLDDKRQPLLPADKLGAVPPAPLTAAEHAKNNLPDLLSRWPHRAGSERQRPRTAPSFCVPKSELVAEDYDLSLSRYKQVAPAELTQRSPQEVLTRLSELELEIQQGLSELTTLLR